MPQSRRVTDAVWSKGDGTPPRSSADSQLELEPGQDAERRGVFDRIKKAVAISPLPLEKMRDETGIAKNPSPGKWRSRSVSRSQGKSGKTKTKSTSLGSATGNPEPDEVAVDKVLEKTLQAVEGYHGYLPREDIAFLLKTPGDYLIRVSETENEDDTPGHSSKMKQIVVSVKTDHAADTSKDILNLIIREKQKKYYIHPRKQFDTIAEVVEDNKRKPRKLDAKGANTYQLMRPAPLAKWEFKHGDVKLCDKELGRGAFGVVQLGELTRLSGEQVKVAIKSSKGVVDLTKEQIKELMNEARLVRDFKSVHVVRTFGVAVDEQPLYIIIEFVDGTSLDKYLKTNKDTLTLPERLTMTLGAARGLHYCHKMNLVHCDISARNCLIVVAKKLVKISDFGLSAPLKPEEVLSKKHQAKPPKLPIKWLAPETLSDLRFTHKSDVYTFGILTFEIMSSNAPYFGMENKDVRPLVLAGRAPDLPPITPEKMASFYQERITIKDEEKRATMEEVCFALATFGAHDAEA